MRSRWQSSENPLYVKVKWIKGVRHAVLFRNDTSTTVASSNTATVKSSFLRNNLHRGSSSSTATITTTSSSLSTEYVEDDNRQSIDSSASKIIGYRILNSNRENDKRDVGKVSDFISRDRRTDGNDYSLSSDSSPLSSIGDRIFTENTDITAGEATSSSSSSSEIDMNLIERVVCWLNADNVFSCVNGRSNNPDDKPSVACSKKRLVATASIRERNNKHYSKNSQHNNNNDKRLDITTYNNGVGSSRPQTTPVTSNNFGNYRMKHLPRKNRSFDLIDNQLPDSDKHMDIAIRPQLHVFIPLLYEQNAAVNNDSNA